MPTEPIIDLSSLDLAQRMVPRAEIERYNPHRGAMALLDAIVWHDAELTRAVAIKQVRDDEFWVSGHIPGRPLMPGVLMVEAGAQLASFLYYKRSGLDTFAGFTRIEDTAFRGQVFPGDTLYILCREVRYSPKRFITDIQGVVADQIMFEGRITGMSFPNLGRITRQSSVPVVGEPGRRAQQPAELRPVTRTTHP